MKKIDQRLWVIVFEIDGQRFLSTGGGMHHDRRDAEERLAEMETSTGLAAWKKTLVEVVISEVELATSIPGGNLPRSAR